MFSQIFWKQKSTYALIYLYFIKYVQTLLYNTPMEGVEGEEP